MNASVNFTGLVLSFGLLCGALACSGAVASPDGESAEAAIVDAPGKSPAEACEATPPPNARCASACPHGYKGAAGTYTCECCSDPTASDAGPGGEICGGPPPNARCMACPGGPNGYKQVDGQPTCECCSS